MLLLLLLLLTLLLLLILQLLLPLLRLLLVLAFSIRSILRSSSRLWSVENWPMMQLSSELSKSLLRLLAVSWALLLGAWDVLDLDWLRNWRRVKRLEATEVKGKVMSATESKEKSG